jgi:hypothetical protein
LLPSSSNSNTGSSSSSQEPAGRHSTNVTR